MRGAALLPLERAGLAAPGTRTGNTQVYSEQIAIWCCLGSNGLLGLGQL